MSKELDCIAICIESIKNDNLKVLDQVLKIMPIEKLTDDNQDVLLSTFLDLCTSYDRKDCAKYILERWNVVYPDNDKLSIIPRLFLNNRFDVYILSFLISFNDDITYVEMMDELAQWDNSPNVVTACVKVETIFGKQPLATYELVRNNAIDNENYIVEDFVVEKIKELSPYAEKPEYVMNYLSSFYEPFENTLPTEKELERLAEDESENFETFEMPSDEKAVEILTEGLFQLGIAVEEIDLAKKLLYEEVSSSEERKRELLLPVLKNQQQSELDSDRLLFWIFGPTNPLVGQDLTLDTPSAKYGGCRMFLCNLFDYDEEYGYVADWFIGNCEKCLLKIQKRCYAVRMPRVHGGWEGCYCSWKCVKERLEDIEADSREPDILRHSLIEAYKIKTEEIGIQDRE